MTAALRIVLDAPDAEYRSLRPEAPFDAERRARLPAADVAALDELARELNETRTPPGPPRS